MQPKTFLTFIFVINSLSLSQSVNAQSSGLREVNGTKLYVQESGKGEVLIVIHGGPGLSHDYFLPHLDPLSKKYKVVYFDQRACGQSAVPVTDSISLSFFIEDIDAIRKITGAKKVNLLAHSWGVLLAVQYGIKYPEHVNKMVLSNPVPLNQEYQVEMAEFQQKHTTHQDSLDRSAILNSDAFKLGDAQAYENLFKVIFRATFYDRDNLTKLALNFNKNFVQANQVLYSGLAKDLGQYDFYPAAEKFQFPVLVLAGAADGIPMASIKKLETGIPRAKLIVFDKSGHFPFIEEPDKFNTEVIGFLKK